MGLPRRAFFSQELSPSGAGPQPPGRPAPESLAAEGAPRAYTPLDEPSALALAYQAGDQTVLGALHRALRPLMGAAFARYRNRPGALPAGLERDDLFQESWLILATLAARWNPAGGSFGAYFRVSFPWALARYVRRNSPSRRARGVVVLGAEQPDVQEQLDARPGADGREWDGDLAWAELLAHLSDDERAVLMLHLCQEQTFTDVARALQLTRPAAYRLYRRALKRVQASPVRVGERTVVLDAEGLNLSREGDLVELVLAAHRGAHENGRLPGRDWLVEQTGLSEQRVTRLVNLLVEAGCVRGRAPRRAGRLVHPTPAETLAALGIRSNVDSPVSSLQFAAQANFRL
jgi:RNA polymerase sigma factor (sigma-70 family)